MIGGTGEDLYAAAGAWPYGGPGFAAPAPPAVGPGHVPPARPPGRPRGRSRAWIAGGVAVAVVLAGGGVAIAHQSGGSTTGSKPTSTPSASTTPSTAPAKDTTAEIALMQAVLDRRAAAVLHHDLTGFLADVDPTQPALVAQEKREFANLRQLPFSLFHWFPAAGYQPDGAPVPDSMKAGFSDYQAVFSPEMQVGYQFRGYDRVPVEHDYAPVFLLRGGRWLLASEQASLVPTPDALDEPWDGTQIAVGTGPHTVVVVSASDARRLPALVGQAEAAIGKVTAMWPTGWNHRAVVYDTRQAGIFASYLGPDRTTADFDGVTLDIAGNQNDPSQQDIRVVLNPAYAAPGAAEIPALLRHEFTHVAKWVDAGNGTPRWAVEGIAEYTAFRGHPQDQRIDGQIGTDARAGRLPRTLPSSASFYGAKSDYNYGIAWCVFEYISETYKEPKVRALYEKLAQIQNAADGTYALQDEDAAFRSVLHISEAKFVKNMNSWIRTHFHPVH